MHTGFQTKIMWNHGPCPYRKALCENFCTKVAVLLRNRQMRREKTCGPRGANNRLFLPEAVENECETKGSNLAGYCDSAFSR